jgi:hypothetical protein
MYLAHLFLSFSAYVKKSGWPRVLSLIAPVYLGECVVYACIFLYSQAVYGL